MTTELQRLRDKVTLLKRKQETKRSILNAFTQQNKERVLLKKELKSLQSPRLTAFKKATARAGISGGKTVFRFLKKVGKNLQEAERRETMLDKRQFKKRKVKSKKRRKR